MVQGILAILFGGAALLWTPLVVDLVAYFIGALFILYSISTVIRGIRGSGKHRMGLVVIGLLGILIGIFAVVHVYVLWITIGLLIAVWALLTGFGDLWLALTAQGRGSFRVSSSLQESFHYSLDLLSGSSLPAVLWSWFR
jgi:uncharacterized membrane protein HdeD (DUF308 family)